MKFSLRWLGEHLEGGESPAGAERIAEHLTESGLEVEAILRPPAELDAFRIARVVAAEPHPDADRLTVCRVDAGGAEAQVVCGAPNVRPGLLGVFAPPGVRIPGTGVELRAAEIRGVRSAGMLLSERELGLSDEHDRILDLPEDAPPGAAYAAWSGLDDIVIDVGVTPNRPDALGVRGIARDLAARGLGRLLPLDGSPVAGSFDSPLGVTLQAEVASGACPHFVGRYFRGLQNGPSPAWMQQRLRAVGLRPISAIVDITNYITHDLCRPLHAWAADRLAGSLQVRFARPGERLAALDGRDYELPAGATVIADGEAAQGLGGIIGGVPTSCDADTRDVFLEAAYFDPVRTAATGRRLNLQTDARYRFERGVDPAFTAVGMEIATRMILQICGGTVSRPVVAGAPPPPPAAIRYRPRRAVEIAAIDMPVAEQRRILADLGFGVETEGDGLRLQPPSWRPPMAGEADIVEEVARIGSFARIPAVPMPRRAAGVAAPALDPGQRRAGEARRLLAARGMAECVCYSFVSEGDAARFGGAPGLRLANPISPQQAVMRPSLLPSLLRAAARNAARGQRSLALFEVGPEFTGAEPGAQRRAASGIRVGDAVPRAWNASRRPADAFDAKADALALVEALGGPAARLTVLSEAPDWYHPGRGGTLGLGPRNPIARFGELHPDLVEAMGLEGRVAAFEVRLGALPAPRPGLRGRPPLEQSNFQAVERDFAFVVEESVAAGELVAAARQAARKLVASAEIFDVFQGPAAAAQLGPGRKSLALAIRLQAPDRTLTEAEIEAASRAIIAAVGKRVGGTLRS